MIILRGQISLLWTRKFQRTVITGSLQTLSLLFNTGSSDFTMMVAKILLLAIKDYVNGQKSIYMDFTITKKRYRLSAQTSFAMQLLSFLVYLRLLLLRLLLIPIARRRLLQVFLPNSDIF